MKHENNYLMSLKSFAAIFCVFIFLSAVAIAGENSIESAQNFFAQGEYEKAIAVLDKLLNQ